MNEERVIEDKDVEYEKVGGKEYAKICCPFHEEQTPSFVISLDGSWICFGCGKQGRWETLENGNCLHLKVTGKV